MRGREDPKANVCQLFRNWLCDVTRGPWLVILDNADDARVLLGSPSASEQADKSAVDARLDYIPRSNDNGQVLVTSRTSESAKELVNGNDIIVVEPMKEEQALTLLRKKLGVWYTEQHAPQLARELDFMPLALTQAAAYICQSAGRCSIQRYLEKLSQCDKGEASVLEVHERDLRRDRESSNSVILTWQVSFDRIREMYPSAADLLSLMSFFDRQAIPEALLHNRVCGEPEYDVVRVEERPPDHAAAGACASSEGFLVDDTEEFEKDLAVLRNYHFVAMTPDTSIFEMHRLVQLATKKWLKASMQLERWGSQFICNLNEAFPICSLEFGNWEICRPLFPHAVAALHIQVNDRRAVLWQASLLLRSGQYASATAAYTDAEKMLERSLQARNHVLGAWHSDTLTSMNNLARIYAHQGQWKKAEEMWLIVVEKRKEVLGKDHPDTLTSMGNLADACSHGGRPGEAEKLELEVMEKKTKILGEDHQDTLTSMHCLATTYSSQGKCEEAEKLQAIVTKKRSKTLGEGHPYTLISKSNLALTYVKQGRYVEAEELQTEVIEKQQKVLGEEHPDTLTSIDNLAWTYLKQGRWEESEELQTIVMNKRKDLLIEGHPVTLTSIAALAYMLRALGRRERALDLMSSCVRLSPHVLGVDHPDAKCYLQVKTQWGREDSPLAEAEAECSGSDNPAAGRAGIRQTLRNALASTVFR